jgi:transposase-like protein
MEEVKPAASRRKYEPAFRAEAVRRVVVHGQPQTRVALGLSVAVLGTWVRAARTQAAGGSPDLARENQQLRTALARADRSAIF